MMAWPVTRLFLEVSNTVKARRGPGRMAPLSPTMKPMESKARTSNIKLLYVKPC